MAREITKAVAYLRTSSKTNVGPNKDSDKRQLAAIAAYAKANGFDVVDTYYDAAVSGADPVSERSGMAFAHRVGCGPDGCTSALAP
jgi:DNA invertase Pin-like site-specific DNA recombinase